MAPSLSKTWISTNNPMAALAGHYALKDAPSRIGAGAAVSVILHLLLLLALRDLVTHHAERPQAERMTLEVLLPPLKQPAPAAPAVPDNKQSEHTELHPPKSRATHHKEVQERSPPITVAPAPIPLHKEPSEPSPHYIDPDAARASVPDILKQLDREKRQQPVGQLMDKPLYGPQEETRLGHQVAKAGRPDCLKEGGNAGLLTPLVWLVQKKGTGCKW
jgi:hypothetical protein